MKKTKSTEEKALVSIIIPVYNGEDYLAEAIESALRQDYAPLEIIVVNDGSNDEGKTRKIALSYDDRIQYYEKENGGVSTALNYGINKMNGDYFVWLSHDDLMVDNRISKQMESIFETGLRISICSGVFLDSGREIYFPATDCLSYEICQGLEKLFFGGAVFMGVMLEKSVFADYGVFNEKLTDTQDGEFLFRILRNEKAVYIRDSLYKYRIHECQGSNTRSDFIDNFYATYLEMLSSLSDADISLMGYDRSNFMFRYLIRGLFSAPKDIDLFCISEIKGEIKTSYEIPPNFEEGVWLYGAGLWGRRRLFDLRCMDILVKGFLDSSENKWGSSIDGIRCCSMQNYNRGLVIICAPQYESEIEKVLIQKGCSSYLTSTRYEALAKKIAPDRKRVQEIYNLYENEGWL